MAYTGTGTQSDPFVVTTFADFLTCVAQEGVYVEVGADIDAAAEGYDYIDPINVAAIKVYADTMHKISNVTVEGNAVFEFTATGASTINVPCLLRLHLENWTWKAAVTPGVSAHTNCIMLYCNIGTTVGGLMRYCKCSISINGQTAVGTVRLVNKVAIMDSAIVAQMYGGTFQPQTLTSQSDLEEIKNTTIRIEGDGNVTYNAGSNGSQDFNMCTNAGIIMKNITFTGQPGFTSNGNGFGYYVFEDCVLPSTVTVNGGKTSNLICFAGTTDASGVTLSGGTQITQAQLKDKAYLQSIGWLP